MPKIVLDKEKCIGCGACQVLCPEYFEMDEYGKSKIKKKEVDKSEINSIQEAIEGCPVQCIKLEE